VNALVTVCFHSPHAAPLLLALLQASGKRPKIEGSKDDIFGQQTGVHFRRPPLQLLFDV
jgi:hypothetical protein